MLRRAYMQEVWKENAVTDMDLTNRRNQEKLGSMPSCKSDTIALVVNRTALLSALREQFGSFDEELLALLRIGYPTPVLANASNSAVGSSVSASDTNTPVTCQQDLEAEAAAKLLGADPLLTQLKTDHGEQAKLALTRDVFEGFLEGTVDADTIGREIVTESQVMNRMIRQRDKVIQLTNIMNFYQIGILGVTSNALGLSSHHEAVLAGHRINIVSGYMVSCLALTALAERHGGWRPDKAQPNLLGSMFGIKSEQVSLSPIMTRYLDSPEPNCGSNSTFRQELLKYWREAKILNVNTKRTSMDEQLSAEGKEHHWWNETINLMNNRIFMLYDLKAVMRSSNENFDKLLSAID